MINSADTTRLAGERTQIEQRAIQTERRRILTALNTRQGPTLMRTTVEWVISHDGK